MKPLPTLAEVEREVTGSYAQAAALAARAGPLSPSPTFSPAPPSAITGNYIDPSFFPFSERQRAAEAPLVIGRLSRPDPAKFPPDFPEFYESQEDVTRIARMTRRGKQFAELRGIRVNHPAPGSASWPGARRWRRFMRGTASMRAGICWRRRRSRR